MTRANGHGIPIVALDIDGTLGDYHGHFLKFAEGYFGREFPHHTQINPGQKLSRFMGLTLSGYRECKLAYRQGGLKRTMPAYPEVDKLTMSIRAAGAEVWLCTTRPYLRLDNIDPDTREWLRRNRVQYDGLIFEPIHGGSKYRELKRQADNRIAAIVEDLPELIREARKVFPDTPLFLRDQPYNRHFNVTTVDGLRVHDCSQMYQAVKRSIDTWKAANEGN